MNSTQNNIEEYVDPSELKLNIQYHNSLNPALWKNGKLNSEVSSKLKEIADVFIEFLEIPNSSIDDIIVTGSNANFNWTHNSDIDLHIVLDLDELREECPGFLDEYLQAKRKIWNDDHDIAIRGMNVELYPQDKDETHYSTGVYSLKDEQWIIFPEKKEPSYDDEAVKIKAADFMNQIDELEILKSNDIEEIEKIKNSIRDMRKTGLSKAGEFSTENLAFKILRNSGYIEKLYDMYTMATDSSLSLESTDKISSSIRIQVMMPTEIRDQIRKHDENADVFDRIKYFMNDSLQHEITIAALNGDKIIGGAGIERSPYSKEPVFWIKYLSIDPEYQGKNIAIKIADAMFAYAEKNKIVLQRSNYTKMGRERLEPIFSRLKKKYPSVDFRDPVDINDFS